jgi:gentisate 1,2-dioxygenase
MLATAMDAQRKAPIAPGSALDGSNATAYTRRALYYTPKNAFTFKLPEVPRHVFAKERDAAFDARTRTGFVPLDLSSVIETGCPATTPTLLARYAVLRAGDSLAVRFRASGEVYYAITGSGETRNGADTIRWKAGDVFALPGGGETVHRVDDGDAVLFLCTDEPALALLGVAPPREGEKPIEATHYPAEEIEAQLSSVHARMPDGEASGKAVLFTNARLERTRTTTPTMAAAINTLEPGGDQRPHRHNAVAITLAIQGSGVYSKISGETVEWQHFAAMVTPPGEVHSHHNRGNQLMRSLVIQDGGLHYHCRTTGFSFTD